MQVADFYEGYKLILGTKRRIEGLSLRATDATWSNGSGPEAAGTMLVLIQAMTGRKAVLTELEVPVSRCCRDAESSSTSNESAGGAGPSHPCSHTTMVIARGRDRWR